MATRDTYYAPGNQLELNKLGEGHSFGVGGGLPGTWRGDGIRGDQPGAVAAQRERGEGDGDRIERQSDRDANGGQGNKSTAQQGQKHLRVNWKVRLDFRPHFTPSF